MTTGCSEELSNIKSAILNDHEGQQFYQMAAEKADVQEVKEIFLSLAEEEKKHEQYLRSLYDSVQSNNVNCPDISFQPGVPVIFDPAKLSKESPSLLVSALSVGVMMEEASIEFYKEAAQKTNNDHARRLYLELAQWEGQHYQALEEAYDFAWDEWWSKQGFSPA